MFLRNIFISYNCTGRVWLVLNMSLVSCGLCDATFARQSDCNRHESGHKPDSFIPCQNCDFVSNRKDSMKRHIARYHATTNNIGELTAPTDQIRQTTPDDSLKQSLKQILPLQNSDFDKRLQLPNNFVYAGSTQSVSFVCFSSTI